MPFIHFGEAFPISFPVSNSMFQTILIIWSSNKEINKSVMWKKKSQNALLLSALSNNFGEAPFCSKVGRVILKLNPHIYSKRWNKMFSRLHNCAGFSRGISSKGSVWCYKNKMCKSQTLKRNMQYLSVQCPILYHKVFTVQLGKVPWYNMIFPPILQEIL